MKIESSYHDDYEVKKRASYAWCLPIFGAGVAFALNLFVVRPMVMNSPDGATRLQLAIPGIVFLCFVIASWAYTIYAYKMAKKYRGVLKHAIGGTLMFFIFIVLATMAVIKMMAQPAG